MSRVTLTDLEACRQRQQARAGSERGRVILFSPFYVREGSAMIGVQDRIFCESLWQMVTSMVGCQWKLAASQYQAGLRLTQAMLRTPVSNETDSAEKVAAKPQLVDEFRKLERRAAERIRQGLAPPKEIY